MHKNLCAEFVYYFHIIILLYFTFGWLINCKILWKINMITIVVVIILYFVRGNSCLLTDLENYLRGNKGKSRKFIKRFLQDYNLCCDETIKLVGKYGYLFIALLLTIYLYKIFY